MMIDAIVWRWPGAQCVVRNEVLERWDSAPAIPRPTNPQIAQAIADYQAQDIAKQQQRDLEIGTKMMQAMGTAIHKRFKLIPADTMTAQQWAASIRAEWDAL